MAEAKPRPSPPKTASFASNFHSPAHPPAKITENIIMSPETSNDSVNPSPPQPPKSRQFRLPALLRRVDWRVACVLALALIVIPVWRESKDASRWEEQTSEL